MVMRVVHRPRFKEIFYQGETIVSKEAFGVKLNAMQGIAPMGEAHDNLISGPGRHHYLSAQSFRMGLDRKGVVAGRPNGAGQACEYASAVMVDGAGPAMERLG